MFAPHHARGGNSVQNRKMYRKHHVRRFGVHDRIFDNVPTCGARSTDRGGRSGKIIIIFDSGAEFIMTGAVDSACPPNLHRTVLHGVQENPYVSDGASMRIASPERAVFLFYWVLKGKRKTSTQG